MKRFLALMLAAALALSLAACGAKTDKETPAPSSDKETHAPNSDKETPAPNSDNGVIPNTDAADMQTEDAQPEQEAGAATYRVIKRKVWYRSGGGLAETNEYSYSELPFYDSDTLTLFDEDGEVHGSREFEFTEEYSFEPENRLMKITDGDNEYSYYYDENGRLKESRSENTARNLYLYWYLYEYDESGRLVKVSSTEDGETVRATQFEFTYDESKNLITRTYGSTRTEYTCDEEGYIVKCVTYDNDGETDAQYAWAEFEYEEITVPEPLPDFMGSDEMDPIRQWIFRRVACTDSR